MNDGSEHLSDREVAEAMLDDVDGWDGSLCELDVDEVCKFGQRCGAPVKKAICLPFRDDDSPGVAVVVLCDKHARVVVSTVMSRRRFN